MVDEEYKRWQNHTVAQLSYAINFFLGLVAAVFAFSVTLIMNEKFILYGRNKYLFSSALLFQLFSMFCGITAVIVRTHNFGVLALIAFKGYSDTTVGPLWRRAKQLASLTWYLFWAQLVFFAISMFSLLTCIFIVYKSKLL